MKVTRRGEELNKKKVSVLVDLYWQLFNSSSKERKNIALEMIFFCDKAKVHPITFNEFDELLGQLTWIKHQLSMFKNVNKRLVVAIGGFMDKLTFMAVFPCSQCLLERVRDMDYLKKNSANINGYFIKLKSIIDSLQESTNVFVAGKSLRLCTCERHKEMCVKEVMKKDGITLQEVKISRIFYQL
jgi:hypothetical protein